MFDELAEAMKAAGWEGVDEVADMYTNEYAVRPIVSGFMTDKDLGAKRLASMPDRMTNTINSAEGPVCRYGEPLMPCVTHPYSMNFSSLPCPPPPHHPPTLPPFRLPPL